jgi:RimJ/RimL family protein N-acetyltransferase
VSDQIEIHFVDGLNGSPALPLAIAGWAEMVEKNFGDGTLTVHADQKAFLAYAANGREMVPVGVMTFDLPDDAKRVWLLQGYVLPEFRGRGIYRALWERLIEHSIVELKARTIYSGTNVRNSAMRAVAKKLGRHEESVILRYDLP